MEERLQRVVRLGRELQRLGERLGADGHDHELLKVDRVVGVDAAVDDVEHRHGQRRRVVAAEVPEEGDTGLRSRSLRGGERHAEDRVRAEPALVRGAVELDEPPVERLLIRDVHATDRVGDLDVDVRNRLGDALAAPRRAAVAELDRFVHAGRCTRGNDRAAFVDFDLDGRVAA